MTGTAPPPLSWEDLANAVAMCATASWDPASHPAWKATLGRMAALHDAGPQGTAPAAPAEPQDPPGEYARVYVAGRVFGYGGWVTEGTMAGTPCLDVRDGTGRLIARVPARSVDLYEPVVLPQATAPPPPQPDATMALPAAEAAYEGYYSGEDDDPGRDGGPS